jgi:hypothetical protein
MTILYEIDNSFFRVLKFSVNHAQVAGNLTDFPVYFDLSILPDIFWENVNVDGSDIRITNWDMNTEVPIEVVAIDTVAKTGELWFKGDVSSTVDTNFYIYYGNPSAVAYSATDTYGSQNVWGANACLIQHFENAVTDSSVRGKNGTVSGATQVQGKLSGKGYSLNGTSDYVSVANGATPILAQNSSCANGIWVYIDTQVSSDYKRVAIKPYGSILGNRAGSIAWNASQSRFDFYMNNAGGTISAQPIGAIGSAPVGAWYRVWGTYDAATGATKLYVNGQLIDTKTGAINDTPTGTASLFYGTEQDTASKTYLKGIIDESNIYKDISKITTEYVSTEYNNQSSPSTFITILDGNIIRNNMDTSTVYKRSDVGGNIMVPNKAK